MKSAKDLTAELKTLEERRETLASDVEAARGKLDAARARLVGGKVKVAEVTATQSTFNALSEATAALDARIMDTRAQLAEAERVAELRAEAARGRAREDRRRVLTAEIHALFENVSAHLEGAVSTYLGLLEEWRREGGDGHFRPPVELALSISNRRRRSSFP